MSETTDDDAVREKRRPLLSVERLSKFYPVHKRFWGSPSFARAVDGVTFFVRHGETLALVGESGCGKTTLGRCVLRLVEPTYGRIVFDGVDLSPLSQRQLRGYRRHMQLVFQDPSSSLDPRMRVGETVAEGIRIHKLARGSEVMDRVEALFGQVGLSVELVRRYPHELSSGQRQRVGIARALSVDPVFVVCDEPVSALDVSVRAQITNLLQDLQDQRRIAYLYISHDLSVVRHMSHRVAVMYLGRLVEVGATESVMLGAMHPYTRALLSAVPVADPTRKRLRIVLEGEVPSPVKPPAGCTFHPRCPKSDGDRCVSKVPTLREIAVGSHHRVACWYPD